MGYTSIYVGNTSDTCKTLMTRELESYGSLKVLKAAMVSGVYYAAYVMEKKPNEVHGLVCLVRKSKGEFIYKDIDEECGPNDAKCPVSILDMLSPTEDKWALEWRARCRAYANGPEKDIRKQLNALPIGTKVIVNDEYYCTKVGPSFGKKHPFFLIERYYRYIPITRIHKFKVIEQTA